jgi:hypothetical protein
MSTNAMNNSRVLVNIDDSHTGGIPFSNNIVPKGIHTMPAPGSNVQSAASIYPGSQKGGKINRKKINKISRKYKMKGSRRTIRHRVRKMKSRVRSKYSRRHSRRQSRRHSKRRMMAGGAPVYPAGHTQYDLNKIISNTYSLGGQLDPKLSALANPPLQQKVGPDPDNLDHNAANSFGNAGAGSGFPSRGWF